MRVVYYTSASFLDEALCFTRAMSARTEFHLILEVAPESWHSGLLDVDAKRLSPGLMPAAEFMNECFPAGLAEYWSRTASFRLAVYTCGRSIHPATWASSHTVMRWVRGLRPDVVHFDDMSLRVAGGLLALGPTPVVVNVHDPQAHIGESNWRTGLVKSLLYRRARGFIVHNRKLAASFQNKSWQNSRRVSVSHLAPYDVYREWMTAEELPQARTVLFFGRLARYKGLDVLYQAARQVSERIPSVRIVIAGRPVHGYEPPTSPHLLNDGRVDVLDQYMPNRAVARLFQTATVVVCPYIDGTQSGVVLTAYAFDRPVIVSDVGGLAEYVRPYETGLLIPPADPAALADALIRVLGDPELLGRLRQGVQRLRQSDGELSWNAAADRVLQVYQSVLATPPAP
jgi:glycosyltransferase involved in cell wall biosynthesis